MMPPRQREAARGQVEARGWHVPDRHLPARIRRHRLYPAWPASTTRTPRSARRGGQELAAAGRQQADRLHPRPAQQSRRQLRRRGQGGRRLHRQGRHHRRQEPQARGRQARSRHPRRYRQRTADRRLGQRRHRARGGTGRRRLAGQPTRRAARHQDLWRERDRDADPAQRQWRDPPDDGALCDAERARDPGQGARTRPLPCRRSSWKRWRRPIAAARPICAGR